MYHREYKLKESIFYRNLTHNQYILTHPNKTGSSKNHTIDMFDSLNICRCLKDSYLHKFLQDSRNKENCMRDSLNYSMMYISNSYYDKLHNGQNFYRKFQSRGTLNRTSFQFVDNHQEFYKSNIYLSMAHSKFGIHYDIHSFGKYQVRCFNLSQQCKCH